MSYTQTPSQTIGPFFAYGLSPDQYGYRLKSIVLPFTVTDDTQGERIRITGRALDGRGDPIDDALLEIWQADARGHYPDTTDKKEFRGFGRAGTGADPKNRFTFDTIKPGAVGVGQAPHINVIVFMRGLLSHVYTRIYFSDEAAANADDPVLNSVDPDRRPTLIAQRRETDTGVVYQFDIHMQGSRETVFFDV